MRTTERGAHGAIGWITAHPAVVLGVFLLVTAALGWQARRFRIDASADTLLMKNNPHYIETQIVNRRFAPQEFLLIAYEPTNRAVLSDQTFDDLRALSSRLRGMERVDAVRSILNVPLFLPAGVRLSSDLDPSRYSLEERGYAVDEIRAALNDHPIYDELLINTQQTAAAIEVLFKPDEELDRIDGRIIDLERKSLDAGLTRAEESDLRRLKREAGPIERRLDGIRRREVSKIRALVAPYENRANIYLGGVHVVAFQLIHIIKHDLVVFGGAIGAMICVVLLALFRRLRWVLIPVACCACGTLSTMGLLGLFGLKATVISSNFIALQLILTLAIVVHLIVQYRETHAEHPDWDRRRLVRETLRRKAAPCFYAGITTSIGFASLLVANIQPVIAFGWMMIIAMFVSIVVSLALFPAAMAMVGREQVRGHMAPARVVLRVFTRLTLRHGPSVFAASTVMLVAGIAGALRLDVENGFLDYFRNTTRVHRELSFIDRQFGGSTPLDLVYTLPPYERTNRPVLAARTVRQMHRIQRSLESHAAVGKVLSLVNLTEWARRLNDNRPLTEYEFTAIYRLMDESLRKDLLGSFFAPEDNQARFSIRIRDTTPDLDRGALLAGIRSDLDRLGIPEGRYSLTNLFVLYQDILQRLFRSQATTLGVVYAVLALAFWIIFRSLKIALIAMVPNLLSTTTVLGVMGWFGIPLDLMTITIAAIAMGIAVDDTIHYVHRYREELGADAPEDAVRRCHDSVGYAVLFTSVIIIAGFSLLSFSDFMPSVYFGLFTALAMLAALVGDLLVLPALLVRFVRA